MSPTLGLNTAESINETQPENRFGLIQEISRTEADILNGADEIRSMIRSTTVELTTIMLAWARHSELKAYLKGLRFLTARPAVL